MDTSTPTTTTIDDQAGLVSWLHVIYGLHAIGLTMGVLGSSTIVGAFLGFPSIIALIIGYLKRGEAEGTWLATHFAWQINTFWRVVGWAILIVLVSLPLTLVLVGFATWIVGLFVLGLWAIYRIARGWMRLHDRMPMTP